MSFAQEFGKIEKYVQENYVPFLKNRLEEAVLIVLSSPYFKLTVCTDLITRGHSVITLTLKYNEESLSFGFHSSVMIRYSPPPSHYEHLSPSYAPPFDFATVARKIFMDTDIRREITDKVVKDFFTDFDVSFVDTPGECGLTFRYKISKRV